MNTETVSTESILLDIIDFCDEKEKSYEELFEEKKSSVLLPLKESYEKLERKLQIKLQTYDSSLYQFSQTLERASDSITPIKRHMHQLKTSSQNVKKCLNVVDSLISLNDSLSGIRISLREDNIEESCFHIHKALSSSPTLKNMRGQHQGELYEIQSQVFKRLVKDLEESTDPKAILKYRKLFAIIGKKDEGIRIYADFLSKHLRQDVEGVVDLNLNKCQLVPRSEDDSTYTDLLSEVLDYCAASVEQHRKFVEEFYGRSRFGILVKKIGEVSKDSIENICRSCVRKVNSQNLTRKRDISCLIDELAVIYERTKRFQDWIDEIISQHSEPSSLLLEEKEVEVEKKKKEEEEYSVTTMKLFIKLSEDFLVSSIQDIWESFVYKEKLLDLLSREERTKVIKKYKKKEEKKGLKKSTSTNFGGDVEDDNNNNNNNDDDDEEEEEEEEGEEELEEENENENNREEIIEITEEKKKKSSGMSWIMKFEEFQSNKSFRLEYLDHALHTHFHAEIESSKIFRNKNKKKRRYESEIQSSQKKLEDILLPKIKKKKTFLKQIDQKIKECEEEKRLKNFKTLKKYQLSSLESVKKEEREIQKKIQKSLYEVELIINDLEEISRDPTRVLDSKTQNELDMTFIRMKKIEISKMIDEQIRIILLPTQEKQEEEEGGGVENNEKKNKKDYGFELNVKMGISHLISRRPPGIIEKFGLSALDLLLGNPKLLEFGLSHSFVMIKNVIFHWFNNELVLFGDVREDMGVMKKYRQVITVDTNTPQILHDQSLKRQAWNISKLIIDYNTTKHYNEINLSTSSSSKKNKNKKNNKGGRNCHDFSKEMLRVLQSPPFYPLVQQFIRKIRLLGEDVEKKNIFRFLEVPNQYFGIFQSVMEGNEDFFVSKKIVFKNHSSLDEFTHKLIKVLKKVKNKQGIGETLDEVLRLEIPDVYQLLKGFDRSFWIEEYSMRGSKEEGENGEEKKEKYDEKKCPFHSTK